jgi:hypothetical protein
MDVYFPGDFVSVVFTEAVSTVTGHGYPSLFWHSYALLMNLWDCI